LHRRKNKYAPGEVKGWASTQPFGHFSFCGTGLGMCLCLDLEPDALEGAELTSCDLEGVHD
jgi:hypothetical protein